MDKRIEVLELWKRTYPNDWIPHNRLAIMAGAIPFQLAIDEAHEAIRLNASAPQPRSNLAVAFIGLNRFDEARQVIQEALAQKIESTAMHRVFYSMRSFKVMRRP